MRELQTFPSFGRRSDAEVPSLSLFSLSPSLQNMSLPGSFTSDSDSGDSIDFDDLQAVTQTDEEEEDSDFSPVLLGEDDEDFIDIDEDDEDEGDTPGPELAEDEQEEPEESGGGALGAEAGQQLRIGYDRTLLLPLSCLSFN